MIKRITVLIICISTVLCLCACVKDDTLGVETDGKTITAYSQKADVDIDLSELSVNIAYSEVYNMFSSPEEYEGKTVRVSGLFSAIYENVEENDLRYTCQISDATACCSLGLEFVPDSSLVFPDDFPLDATKITVRGTLKSKDDEIPIYISDAVIEN